MARGIFEHSCQHFNRLNTYPAELQAVVHRVAQIDQLHPRLRSGDLFGRVLATDRKLLLQGFPIGTPVRPGLRGNITLETDSSHNFGSDCGCESDSIQSTFTLRFMTRKTFTSFIGLAGVADDESPRAQRWGRFLEVPMLLLALWIVVEWYLTAKDAYPNHWGWITNWIVWFFFVIETSLLCYLVHDRRRYLKTNWINLLIIAVGIPLLFHHHTYAGALRTLRVLLLFGILFEMSSTIRQMLAQNNIGLTLFVSLIIVVMAGTSMAAIDPAINTFWDGIWWAWVTVTTVGYGDLVPESPQGKVFGGLLMILGLGLFSLITASFSAFLISREEEEVIEKGAAIIEQEKEVASEERRAIAKLERIENRLEGLERNLGELIDRLPVSDGDGKRKD